MAATLCAKCLPKQGWIPLAQSVRHGSKAVTRHRRPVHILKQKLLAVTQYVPPPRAAPPDAYPRESQAQQEESPLTLIKKRQLETLFEDCKMIAVVQNNNSSSEDMIMFKHRLHKHGISVKFFPNQVVRSFLRGSAFSNMAPLFTGPTVLLVSPQLKVKEMLTSLRSSPQMTLLGACIEKTLLSSQGVVGFSRLPSAAAVQGELVGGLTAMTARTASMLQRHPAHLSALLQQYVKQQSPEAGRDPAARAEDAS
ncbi:large ribosomal subunit protein uL10m [Salarias fasciatus]|uniref:Large ribosomal subunit protein uL10m n=1 Tax=Salarias fasciatus TaxID=181472 RepID=A0A672H4V2_SALFA|nr:39S ribosomal protein L10, mitochondrial [Salarias fasciatus]